MDQLNAVRRQIGQITIQSVQLCLCQLTDKLGLAFFPLTREFKADICAALSRLSVIIVDRE